METPAWRRGFLFAPGSLDTGARGALPRCGRAPVTRRHWHPGPGPPGGVAPLLWAAVAGRFGRSLPAGLALRLA